MGEYFKNARALYDQGKYADAIQLCGKELGEADGEQMEALLLGAKCLLQLMAAGLAGMDRKETLYNSVKTSCEMAKTAEDLTRIEREVLGIFEELFLKFHENELRKLQRNPTLDQWKQYIPLQLELANMRLELQMTARTNAAVDRLAGEAGMSVPDFRKQTFTETPPCTTAETVAALQFEYENRIFDEFRQYFAQNQHCNMDFAQRLGNEAIQRCLMLDCLASAVDRSSETAAPEIRRERLLKHAEILDFYLNAVVYANGNSVYVNGSNRDKQISELEKLYQKVREIDPGFIPPQLPPENVGIVRAQQSSGGCYVATAVYGSYDCPQVWTLRRYRDGMLAKTWYGRAFIHTYYTVSPTLVRWFGNTQWFKNLWKPRLDRMVEKLRRAGVADTPYQDKDW